MEKNTSVETENRGRAVALLPIGIFLVMFIGSGIITRDFYAMPTIVAFLIALAVAFFQNPSLNFNEKIKVCAKGIGDDNVIIMCLIFLAAGGFSGAVTAAGGATSAVYLGLSLIPPKFAVVGVFLIGCFISISMGTSVGTIVALVPVAAEISGCTGLEVPLVTAAVVGGSFFGDNLSFISDTTVAATRTQGCTMRDKFRTNFRIVFPAALVCMALYVFIGLQHFTSAAAAPAVATHWWRVLPYIVVLAAAVKGFNVLLVLCSGCLLTGIVGMAEGSYTLSAWMESMASGIAGMGELILVSMMAGGLLAVVRKGGGVTYLVRALTRRVHTRRGAECCISALVAVTNCCTANNTVAILSVGGIARDISERFGVDKRRAASLLDIFSCIVQGFIPYGAQLLMAAGLAAVSSVSIIPFLFYPMLVAVTATLSIAFSKKE